MWSGDVMMCVHEPVALLALSITEEQLLFFPTSSK